MKRLFFALLALALLAVSFSGCGGGKGEDAYRIYLAEKDAVGELLYTVGLNDTEYCLLFSRLETESDFFVLSQQDIVLPPEYIIEQLNFGEPGHKVSRYMGVWARGEYVYCTYPQLTVKQAADEKVALRSREMTTAMFEDIIGE